MFLTATLQLLCSSLLAPLQCYGCSQLRQSCSHHLPQNTHEKVCCVSPPTSEHASKGVLCLTICLRTCIKRCVVSIVNQVQQKQNKTKQNYKCTLLHVCLQWDGAQIDTNIQQLENCTQTWSHCDIHIQGVHVQEVPNVLQS